MVLIPNTFSMFRRISFIVTLFLFSCTLIQAQSRQSLPPGSQSTATTGQNADAAPYDDPTRAYGTITPGIMRQLADSGAFNAGKQKIGRWSEYQYTLCPACPTLPLHYDSLAKYAANRPGELSLQKETGPYNSNLRQGVWHTYESFRVSEPFDWKLSTEVMYRNNKKEGWEKTYNHLPDSSSYEYQKTYYKNGVADGPFFEFNEFGDTTWTGQYQNGQRHGKFKFIQDTSGVFNYDVIYEHGKQVETLYYHKNGTIASRGLRIDFNPHGIYRSYNESGILIFEQTYNHGTLEGISRYYDAGKLTMTENFKEGQSHGRRSYYFPNGQLALEIDVQHDKPWTVISSFDQQGNEKKKGTLKNGNGTVKSYYPDGKLAFVERYTNGELVTE